MLNKLLGKKKNYNLIIPMVLYNKMQEIASENGIDVTEFLRKCIRLGMVAAAMEKNGEHFLVQNNKTGELTEVTFK